MKLPVYQVDAFTNRVFAGNPAAVVILNRALPDVLMAQIAAEHNLSETAFVIPEGVDFPLRWFTPSVEVDLCGHATLASAYILFQHYFPNRQMLSFSTRSGILKVSRNEQGMCLCLPARPVQAISVSAAVERALGERPREVWRAQNLLVLLDSEEAVARVQPDMQKIAALDCEGVIVTARSKQCDFVSRYFAPQCGIPEDPVTGSAHCTLVPFWAQRLEKNTLTARQLSRRGGELSCQLVGEDVLLSGEAVQYLQGEISLPD